MKKLADLSLLIREWRLKHLNEHQLTVLLSLIVGLLSGLAAILLQNTIHFASHFLTHDFTSYGQSYQYLAYPGIGILITMLFVKYVVKDDIGHGVAKILFAISNKKSIIKLHNTITSMIGSVITIGFGGSVGAEAPVALTGSSIGSNIARMFRLDYRMMTLMVGCGAAGAISGIFKAPLAGLVFAIEVLMLDLTMSSLIPLLIASASAALLTYFFMGQGYHFSFHLLDSFDMHNIVWYIVLGVLCGFISLLFTRGTMYIEGKFKQLKNPYARVLVGALVLGGLVFLFPSLWGEGYFSIDAILNGHSEELLKNSIFVGLQHNEIWFLVIIAAIILTKIVASSVTTASGGVGGIFAPALFLGGMAGFFMAKLLGLLGMPVPVRNFALVGMAGAMAGVMHAPMTAIFLIAEITGGFSLYIPLMITSAVSYLTIIPFEPLSIYHIRLAERGELITHDKDKAILTLLKLRNVIETDLLTVPVDANLGELVRVISTSKRNIFPVVDKNNRFEGIVLLDDIREIMFNKDMYDKTFVTDVMTTPPAFVSKDERMESVMKKFHETGAWNLPVLEDGKYIGFISKAAIFNAYRSVLVHFSE
jgi:CIC family chloride channel protein